MASTAGLFLSVSHTLGSSSFHHSMFYSLLLIVVLSSDEVVGSVALQLWELVQVRQSHLWGTPGLLSSVNA